MKRGALNASPVPKTRWYRIGLPLFLIYLICFADRSNIGVAAPEMVRDLQLSGAITGTVLSAFFWGYVVTQLPGGWLAGTIGPRRVVVGALMMVGVTGCLTGMATHLSTLLAIRFCMGLAEGVVWPSFAVLFVNWFPVNERGRAVSLSQYALPISSVIMAPLAGWMITAFHWRTMFFLQGLPAIILGLIFYFLASDDPVTDRWITETERDHIVRGRVHAAVERSDFRGLLTKPVIWGFCLTYFLWITGMYGFGLWMPTLLKQVSAGLKMESIGWLTAVPYAFATLGMVFVSRIADRASFSRGWLVACALSLAGLALLTQHFIVTTVAMNMTMLVLAGIGIYSAIGAWWSWALASVPRNQVGPAIGLINLCGNFGGICGPLIVGLAAGSGPASGGLYLVGVSMLVGATVAGMLALCEKAPHLGELPLLTH